MQGDLIDLDTQVNLTEVSRNDARRDLMSTLDDEVISFLSGRRPHTVYGVYRRRLRLLPPPAR